MTILENFSPPQLCIFRELPLKACWKLPYCLYEKGGRICHRTDVATTVCCRCVIRGDLSGSSIAMVAEAMGDFKGSKVFHSLNISCQEGVISHSQDVWKVAICETNVQGSLLCHAQPRNLIFLSLELCFSDCNA